MMKDFWSKNLNIKKDRKKIKKIISIACIITIIITIAVAIILYVVNVPVREWIDIHILQKEKYKDDLVVINYNPDSNAEICTYDKYVGILSKNKFGIYNNSGKEEANIDIPVNDVSFSNSGKFLGIGEKNGQNVFLISGKNLLWNSKIEGSISKINVNKNGYLAVVITDTSYKTIVSLYNPKGDELFKIYLSNTRVSDVTISNDNKYLALAEIDTTSSIIKSNVKIVSIENAQTDTDNSIVYIHNAESNKLLINIKYQEKNKLLCMYDNSIDLIKDNNNTEIINFNNRKASFSTINLNNGIAIVEEKISGLFTADSEIVFINPDTQNEKVYSTKDVTKEIYSYGDIVALNLGTEIHFVNNGGWLVKKYIANQEISKVFLSEALAAIVYRDKIEIVNF